MTPEQERSLAVALRSIESYSRYIVQAPLRPYQLEPALAIVDSVIHRRGLTFTIMMSRQAGKNELSAQLEAYLLTLYSRRGGSIVKVAPTFRPQIVNSLLRLDTILENPLTAGKWATSQGYIRMVGKAKAFYFSAEVGSSIVGGTASLLLEVDEAQDVDEEKYSRDVRPMGASTNATTVLYGTAWTSGTLLERQRQENLRLEQKDGVRRDFKYAWEAVAAVNADYGLYVAGEIERKGREHPVIRTQYLLEVLDSAGRLFSPTYLAQLGGTHERYYKARADEIYVAGVDLAGEDETAADAELRALKPRKDSTAVTIARLEWRELAGVLEPHLEVVDHLWVTGQSHRELLPRLRDYLGVVWRCSSVVVDSTGIGATIASFLVGALGADVVHPFAFSSVSKSDLGFQLLAAVGGGRLKMYAGQDVEVAEFWSEAEVARSVLGANQRMAWRVDESDGHDDLVVSAALVVEASKHAEPRVARGRVAAGR